MKITVATLLASLLLSGCASTQFGHSPEEWSRMSQGERDRARTQAENRLGQVHEKQREKKFLYQSVNVIFGSRSNVYGDQRNLY